nr:MAG TPA: hypothetical protein [Caudoviricetes sp.]
MKHLLEMTKDTRGNLSMIMDNLPQMKWNR